MIERGGNIDDFEEEDEGQSEDDSNMSRDSPPEKNKPNKAPTNGKLADLSKTEKNIGNVAAVQNTLAQQQLLAATNPADYNRMLVVGEGYGRDFLKSEIERLIRVLQDKQSIGKDVHTFIRTDGARKGWEEDNNQKAGLFSDRGAEMEKIEGDGDEDESHGKDSSDKNSDTDSLKANIKSKKAFSMAINDKTMPPAIKKLSTFAQIILLCLVAIAITEYAVMYKQVADTKANFILIEKSQQRTAELQKVAYNARSMIYMAQNILTNYAGFASRDEFVAYIKSEF